MPLFLRKMQVVDLLDAKSLLKHEKIRKERVINDQCQLDFLLTHLP